MKKTLEVGDVVYCTQFSGRITKLTVSRVTATQAVVGHSKIKREHTGSTYAIGSSGWTRPLYDIETPELKAQYEAQKAQ